MRYNTSLVKWEFIGGAPINFRMEGENAAYAGFTGSQPIAVNASSKLLQWLFTPPMDVWVDVEALLGLVQKVDANYHYAQFSASCNPVPAIGAGTATHTITQHSAVQQFEGYRSRYLAGLTGGVAYTINASIGISGGTWQYHQANNMVSLIGRAWPR
jgi:hypothetical protein